jgi:Zn-dependent peptidase ImmA (M78 family)
VPIDLIVEATYELEVLWDRLPAPPDSIILGALFPRQRRIVLNEQHAATFDRWIGPERFTLAHELAHWIYDADDPNQLALELPTASTEEYCYHRQSPGLPDVARIREVNANKLAAHLLLPEHLLRQVDLDSVLGDFRQTAALWGVSQQTLQIRLETMGLISPGPGPRLAEM